MASSSTLRTARLTSALFLPSLNIPLQAYPSFIAGASIVFACIYSTTIGAQPRLLALFRMALSIPGSWLFIRFAWSSGYPRDHNRATYLGMATMSLYGIMKLLEVCWIRELDNDKRRWVLKPDAARSMEKKVDGEIKGTANDRVVLPIPTDVRGRLVYTFDYLTTIRGCSWFADRVWDFAPPYALTYSHPNSSSKFAFLEYQLISLAIQVLLMDVFDVFIKSIDWAHLALTTTTPVTSLPLHLQLLSSFTVLITTMLYLSIPDTFMTTILVMSGAASPSSCPPMFDSPLESASLQDFWSFRWHHIFRRTFERMGQPVLLLLPSTLPKTRRVVRQAIAFFLSATLHLLLFTTLPLFPPSAVNPNPQAFPFLDWNTVKFFLAQPLGLILESFLIFPLTEGLNPRAKTAFRRAYAWIWLLFTGRYWSDSWTAKGLFNADTERPIVFSPVRGVLWGSWRI
ncbi:hypothetical protein FS837_003215 [Tulasnella sp. UAMH 9824]|nr:hypothetical protein FS837_003215 [Tulasnella sp. UAMH 9824]